MEKPDQVAHTEAYRTGTRLQPFMLKQLILQLRGDALLRERAGRFLKLLEQDVKNELNLQPLDFFLPGHLSPSEIGEAAHERSTDKEGDYPHLKTCSMCNAFVETEAARMIIKRGLKVSLSGLGAKVPEGPTDNQKWFGKTQDHRF